MNQIKILERIWKTGLAIFTATVLAFGGFFLSLPKASATEAPYLTAKLLINDKNDVPDAGWQHYLNSQGGHRLSFMLEIHNTKIGTVAESVKAKVVFPSGTRNTLNPIGFGSANNANTANDSVTIAISNPPSAASLDYVEGSTR